MGYSIKLDAKYPAIRPPDKDRYFRFKSLGEKLHLGSDTAENSSSDLHQNAKTEGRTIYHLQAADKDLSSQRDIRNSKKITGLRALYYHYLYKMGILPQKPRKFDSTTHASVKRTHFLLREDLRKLDRITAETKFLCTYRIDTTERLTAHQASAEAEIKQFTNNRKHMRYRLRNMRDESEAETCKKQIAESNRIISNLRKEVQYCAGILARSEDVREKLAKVKKEENHQKEMKLHEHKRGRSRSSR
jgi:hypothetical protein